MKIAIINDNPDNKVLPISTDTLKSYINDGHTLTSNIDLSHICNSTDISNINEDYESIDFILTNGPLKVETITKINPNTIIIGSLNPYWNKEQIQYLIDRGITSFSLDLITRSTKAQYMDVLSSQASLAGYKAVIECAYYLNKAMPLMMTTAGTVRAATVLVIGAGVAGLQAIATAKRLGAKVIAFDVRAAAKEQVESLGAKFIEIPNQQNSVYADIVSKEYQQAQNEALMKVLPFQDIIITTAQIPGKKAPIIITKEMLNIINKNAIIADLSYNTGGNCQITDIIPKQSNSIYDKFEIQNGPTTFGYKNILNTIWQDASNLYAKNIYTFFQYLLPNLQNDLQLIQDDIIQSTLLTYQGQSKLINKL